MTDHDMVDEGEMTKLEVSRDGTPSSIESSPEQEGGPEASQEPAQPQKRKGGRKPIYATSEERKQRNRQAQAAFRERRTEYIKQLEANIKQNEEMLNSLQENHRRINNDCLMLRYKNSLLERILLEKGIDVQAELEMKQSSPSLGTGFMSASPNLAQTPTSQLQRTALQRQQARMTGSRTFLPKIAPGQGNADMNYATSPHAHPTPSSHASSPSQLSTRSPMAMHQGGMTSPVASALAQPQAQQFSNFARASQAGQGNAFDNSNGAAAVAAQAVLGHVPSPQSAARPASRPSSQAFIGNSHQGLASNAAAVNANATTAAAQSASSFYPSPFQKHFDQLDQEYDAHTARSMLDDPDSELPPSSAHPSSADAHRRNNPHQHLLHQQQQQQQHNLNLQSATNANAGSAPTSYTSHFDVNIPNPTTEFYSSVDPTQQLTPQTQIYESMAQSQQQHQQQPLLPPTSHPMTSAASAGGGSDGHGHHFGIDPNDPLLDSDPFGLSASMHYPTAYSFEHQHQQQRQQPQQQGPR